jgi:hypothetical protein
MRARSLLLLAAILPACTPSSSTTSEGDLTGTHYYPIETRLTGADLTRWEAAKATLIKGFDDVCGDTFCEGDYSNMAHVALDCSITQSGYVKECTWVLGGSIEYVDGATGTITVDAKMWSCTIPVQSKTTPFLEAAESGVQEPMPGSGKSFYEGLSSCLAGVIGNQPPASTGTTYVELADYLGGWEWFGQRDALSRDFAGVCGDTFCEGKYANITGLRLACATNSATGAVVGCRWTFAESNLTVNSKGHVSPKNKLTQCPISVQGQASAVTTALTGTDPLNAPLPGSNKSLMTQLGACL